MDRRTQRKNDQTAVAVVGAGWIGSEIVRRLAEGGHPVVATNRSGIRPEGGAGVRWERYDSTRDDSDRLTEVLDGIDAAIVCWAPSSRGADRRDHYVGGAKAIIAACAQSRLQRLIYTSSTSALPSHDGEIDETCNEWPASERGRVQREAEEVIREGCARLAIPWVILRLAGLYGPGRGLEQLYRWEDGKPLAGDGAAPTNLIHLDDVCRALEASLALPADKSGVVHVCDGDHRTRRQAFADQAHRQGRDHPIWELPESAPRGKRVSNRKLKDFLGVELLHPTRSQDP